jgi:nucleoside phosphorylase
LATRPAGRVLVFSAWDPELAVLRAALARDPALARRVVARAAGVGLVEAGIGATAALAETTARAVIFVGTAGIYPGASAALAVGGAVAARRLKLVSTAALRGEGYLPAVLPVAVEVDARLRRALALPLADVACPVAITSTRRAARTIASETGCSIETLEAFAVARAAAARGVPFAAVLGLSNAVGPSAHAEWKRFAAPASAAACAAVLAWLRAPTRR